MLRRESRPGVLSQRRHDWAGTFGRCDNPPHRAESAVSIPPATLPQRSSEPDESRSRDATRVIKAATDVNGDVHRASSWYKDEPLSAFASKTAEQLVREGRTEDVLHYLVSLEAGAAG